MRDPTSTARVSTPESERWLGPLSCALILLTPFVVFIRHHGYPLASPEFLVSAGVLAVAALVIGALAATHSVLLRVVAIGSFVVLLIDIQTEWITSWWWALTALVPPVLLGWLVRQRVAAIFTSLAAVMILTTLPMPGGSEWSHRIENEGTEPRADLPPIVHIILDEHIGVAGIPREFDPESRVRDGVRERYLNLGFRVYGRAFSRHYATFYSLSHLLGYGGPFRALDDVDIDAGVVSQNPYFEEMSARGYRIHVFQTDGLDYCQAGGAIDIASCRTQTLESTKAIESTALTTRAKVQIMTGMFMRLSFVLNKARRLYNRVASYQRAMGGSLPDWTDVGRVSSLSSMAALPVLENSLAQIGPGELHFVHLMLPHFPFAYRRDCSLRPIPSEWLASRSPATDPRRNDADTRARRYPDYLEQVECVTREFGDLIERLDRRGSLSGATIIVQSDHGSRLDLGPPAGMYLSQFEPQDFMDAFSILFAVRGPGLNPGYDDRSIAGEELFDALIHRGQIPDGADWPKSQSVYFADVPGPIERPMRWVGPTGM